MTLGSFDSKPILMWLQRDAEATGNLSFVRYCQSWGVLTLNRSLCGLQRYAEATGNFVRCLQLSQRGSFDSKPILLWFATRCRGNRKFCSLSSTVKAEARFRVKTKIRREVSISEQFQPSTADEKKISSFTIVEFVGLV